MNKLVFIRTLNSIAEAKSIAYEAPYLTTFDTMDGGQEDSAITQSDSDLRSWFMELAASLGLAAIGAALLNKYLNNKKMVECLRLLKRHLNIVGGVSSTGRSVFSILFEKVFGFPSRLAADRFRSMSTLDIIRNFRQLFNLVNTEGFDILNRQINSLQPDAVDSSSGANNIEDLRKKLKNCLSLVPNVAKDIIKEVLIKRFPNLAQPIQDMIKYAIDRYLVDGKLEEFAYSVVIAIGSALTASMAVDLASLIVSGFTESYGVGTAVLVAALAAGLVALSAFFVAGGTVASIAAWLSTTATSAILSAASAAGAALNPAAIQRIQQILEDIARRAAPAM